MKTSFLLALVVLAPLATAGETAPSAPPTPPRTYLPRRVQLAPPPSALHQRLEAIRARYAGLRVQSPQAEAREARRLEESRPLPSSTLGALSRRTCLGDRTLTSPQDRRLGSQARRQLLSRAPVVRRQRR